MSFEEYKQFLEKTDTTVDSPEAKIVQYLKMIEEGKKIFKWPPPWFILILSIVQIITFYIPVDVLDLKTYLQFDTNQHGEVWRYLTYSLIHLDILHLVSNLLLLVGVGGFLEMRHGYRRVALLYVLGVLCSSLAYYCFDSHQLCGTSGGVYCLVASSLCTTILNWHEDQAFLINRFRLGKAPIACGGKLIRLLKLLSILAFVLGDFGSALHRRYAGQDIGVSVVAHVFGSLAGFLVGFSVLKDEKEELWEKRWKIVCLSVFVLLLGVGLVLNIASYRDWVGLWDSK